MREGFDEHPDRLGDHTIGEIMAIRAFGPRCLVDLLCALESPARRAAGSAGPAAGADPGARLSEELTAAASRLAGLPAIVVGALARTPDFCRSMRELDVEAETAAALAARLLARTQDPPDLAYTLEQVRRLCERIERMPQLTLEEELIEVFAPASNPRNAEILDRLLRLARRAAAHADRDRPAVRDYAGADPPGVREADPQAAGTGGDPGPGNGPRAGDDRRAAARPRRT